MPDRAPSSPVDSDAVLVLADGTQFWGYGVGAPGLTRGEICFNTSMTGYQEILTDPSYAGQIITFTFPHIGNVGANPDDTETVTPVARGLILRERITAPANYRSTESLDTWLRRHGLTGIAGVDTRRLTRRLRDLGAVNGCIHFPGPGRKPEKALAEAEARACPDLTGQDLASTVGRLQTGSWPRQPGQVRGAIGGGAWVFDHRHKEAGGQFAAAPAPRHHVVAIDYGVKHNILRCLSAAGCRVTVVPFNTSLDEVLSHRPDGVFLSNGPGDPAATARYAVPTLQGLLEAGLPLFGICLGHQMLALALGAKTTKMPFGHRGANHPVQDLATGRVEITSQNHGFVVEADSLPDGVSATHISLFDRTLEGLALKDRPVFSVQYHPEASPGPQDSHYLFERFVSRLESHA